MRAGARLPMPLGIRQLVLDQLERAVLVRIVDRRRDQLLHLEAQQVDLPRPCPSVPTESRQLGVELGEPSPRRP